MHRMTILYRTPDDVDAFRSYYLDTHVPIARRIRGLTAWNLSWIEQDAEAPVGYVLVAELYAESSAALTAALESPEGRAARDDLQHFAGAGVEFLRGEEDPVPLA